MDVLVAIEGIRFIFNRFIDVLDSIVFYVGIYQVSFLQMIVAALVTGFVISVFWRGART